MRLAVRTVLLLAIATALSLGLYIAADSTFGSFGGPGGVSGNFVGLISAWKALGGTAAPLSADRLRAGGRGAPPFAMAGGPPFGAGGSPFDATGRREVPITDGLDLSSAPGQTGSDVAWLAIPAAIAALIEIAWTAPTRRRRKKPVR